MKALKFLRNRIFKSPITSVLGSILIIMALVAIFTDRDITIATTMLTGGISLVLMKDSHLGIGSNNNDNFTPPDIMQRS